MESANRRLLILLFASVLALLFVAQCSICAAAETQQPPTQEETVQVPLSKLIELQSLMNSQEQKIKLLEQQLTEPQATLKEQQNLISELRQNLQEAKSSLDKSELIISEQNKSLASLSQTIRQDAKRTKRIERQRTIWQAVAGGLAVVLVKGKSK